MPHATTFVRAVRSLVPGLLLGIILISSPAPAQERSSFGDSDRRMPLYDSASHASNALIFQSVDIGPAEGLDFGSVTLDHPAHERRLTITNPAVNDVTVRSLSLSSRGDERFTILRTKPMFDWNGAGNPPDALPDSLLLPPGALMEVFVSITPARQNATYLDSLIVELCCSEVAVPLRAVSVDLPCLFVGDLDFGTLLPGQSRTLNLEICNNGDGEVRFFGNLPGDPANAFITWFNESFGIGAEDQALLRNNVLGPNECLTIQVTFSTPDTRTAAFRTVARLWANTRDCRDTSIWTATVIDDPTDVPDDSRHSGFSLASVSPNPSSGSVAIALQLDNPARTELTVHDVHGERVATLVEGALESGEHTFRWEAGELPAGHYTVRAVMGDRSESRTILLVR